MKKGKGIIVAVAMLLSGWAQAQEYKVAKNTGRLEIYLGRVTVEPLPHLAYAIQGAELC